MRALTAFTVMMALSIHGHCQVVPGRQVLGCMGASQASGEQGHISVSVGEAVAGSRSRGSTAITKGFQQPSPKSALYFELLIEPASCPTSTDGMAEVIDLSGCAGPFTVEWSNGITGLVNDRLSAGSHSVTITGAGCSVSRQFEVGSGPLDACILRFFTAFSPNGDGINDTWLIENIERSEFHSNEVQIFNRWGQEVWRAVNYNNRSTVWDGRDARGKPLPAGTYFFVADVDGVLHKGYVEITL